MRLPFTETQFLDVLGAFNSAVPLVIAGLWVATLAIIVTSMRRSADQLVGALLAVHWMWSGVAYHWLYFTRINPAAWAFGALFVIEGAAFAWFGVSRRRLAFRWGSSPFQVLGALLVICALAYPGLVAACGFAWPRMPAFGVPCPTTLLTVGLLSLTSSTAGRWLAVIPAVWGIVGGAAAFLLGVLPDYGLIVAASIAAAFILVSRRTVRPA